MNNFADQNETFELEATVIGGILSDEDCREYALSVIKQEDFEFEVYRELYGYLRSAAQSLVSKGMTTDKTILLTEISSSLGPEHRVAISKAIDSFLLPTSYKDYVRVFREKAMRRRIINRVDEWVYLPPQSILQEMEQIVQSEEVNAADSLEEKQTRKLIEYITYIHEKKDPNERFYTGIGGIDKKTGGIRRKTVSIIGARPSVGKTALAINIAKAVYDRGKKVAIFSLEMSFDQIMERVSCCCLGIPYSSINTDVWYDKKSEERSKQQITGLMDELKKSKRFYVLDDIYSIEGIVSAISELKPDFVVVDFVQIVQTLQNFRDRRTQIDHISSELKRAAKQKDCHIMILSQIAREGDEAPKMSHLKESGGLEQDGDYIFILHRPFVSSKNEDRYEPEEAGMLLDKNKYGGTGQVEMRFIGEQQKFVEVDTRYER